ncbi:MAG: hypothetical protein A2Y71_03010 [Bacteroidetes bacterium RBG_13_42_15]|nr:MAG: hypothetical protein A2Y71_03010 [Bacteroidetes bacterium RBG_13_42_15]
MTRIEKIKLIEALRRGEKSLDDIFYSPIIIKYPDGTYSSNGRKITEARIKSLSFPQTIILPDNGRELPDVIELSDQEREKDENDLCSPGSPQN